MLKSLSLRQLSKRYFGDSLATQDESSDEEPKENTVVSLSDLLPDEQTSDAAEDFPENVPR